MDANGRVNVLLVDDQPGKLLSYEVMLGELDENLIKTSSAKEALEVLLKTDVAVILVDVCMPEFDGFELARMIRDHPRYQKTAIIFISAIHISEADSLRGYDCGAVDYVPVPVVPEVLRAKVRVFAELYRKTRMLEELNRELETRVADRTAALEATATRLIESERGRSLALAAGNMGSWEYNFEDDSWTIDEGQYRIFGLEPDGDQPTDEFVRSLFREEDWERMLLSMRTATSEQRSFQSELRLIRGNGEARWCLVTAAVTFDQNEKPQRVSGVTIDITDRKEAELKQMLLAREVDHRARNALAVVQAIVRLGRAKTTEDYIVGVEGRVRALARSHEFLSQSRWQGADLKRLVEEEFAPYQSGDGNRATLHGPAIILPPDKAQSVALIIHELATNAAKYGALSGEIGSVDLAWDLRDSKLKLCWIETKGPRVTPPTTKGFGTKIIDASLNKSRGDSAAFQWSPDGLHCEIVLTLSAQRNETQGAVTTSIRETKPQDSKPRILIVEDEGLVGALTTELIEQMGYSALGPCVNLSEAMSVMRRNHIDGAVLDVNLGGELVFPLAKALAERSIPLVFLTGYEKSAIGDGFEACPVLQKPVAADDLRSALAIAMRPAPLTGSVA
jgi:PAS domain S-box-containing protein